jgi:UDP-arabinose 4-epimerase
LKVLVTGGAGYIGSHTCKALAAEGHEPISYDNLSRGNRSAVKWGPFVEGDVADASRLRSVLELYRPAALMHFAAYAYVEESVRNPLMYYENNFVSTVALLRAIIDFQRIPIVFSSTCATYGVPDHVPISEDQRQAPINPYGRSKLYVEHLLRDLGSAHGLPWIALRYFNASGADPDGEIGEQHDPETHLIPLAIQSARTGSALRVFGTDHATPDGSCVRDFIHVSDIARAHVRALNYLINGGESCALNLANARGYSVRDVIRAVEKIAGRRITIKLDSRRNGDPPILIGQSNRACNLLGWRPIRSALETQISDAWKWFEKNLPYEDVGISRLGQYVGFVNGD